MGIERGSSLGAKTAIVASFVVVSLWASNARAQGAVVTYDYRAAGERQDGELRHCPTRTRGVGGGNLIQSPVNGLGRTGQPDIFAIDPGEGVRFEFTELQTQIPLALENVTNSNGTGPSGEFTTNAFIENDVSIDSRSSSAVCESTDSTATTRRASASGPRASRSTDRTTPASTPVRGCVSPSTTRPRPSASTST